MILIVSIKKAFTFKIIYSIVLSHNDACLSTVFQYADCGLWVIDLLYFGCRYCYLHVPCEKFCLYNIIETSSKVQN